MQSKAKTVDEYLAEVPTDRREALQAIRSVILDNLPKGYEEGMQYGMIGYFVPHSIYPPGYHCDPTQPVPYAGLASQKNYISIYLMCIYGHPEHEAWFRDAWAKTGKKLDMGKSCIRIKKLDDVPLHVIGDAVKRVPVKSLIEYYESIAESAGKRPGKARATKVSARPSAEKPPRTSARKRPGTTASRNTGKRKS